MSSRSLLLRTLFVILVALAPLAALGQNCSLGPQIILEGATERFYRVPTVPKGGSCSTQEVIRTCKEGNLNGDITARYGGCTVLEGFVGVNTNRRPGNLEPALLSKTGTKWVRTNVDILSYKEKDDTGKADPKWNFGDWDRWKTAAAGPEKKAILNLMWDFEQRKMRIPLPGSSEERALFAYLDARILTPLASSADIITSGNEPFINSLKQDWSPKSQGGDTPIVVFYKRVTAHVDNWLRTNGLRDKVKLYVGSFTRLHTKVMQDLPAVQTLLEYADQAPYVDGIDMHTHVTNLRQIEKSLQFARRYTEKPIIVTEYTLVHAMRQAVENRDRLGPDFAGRWKLDPQMTINDYMACRVFKRGSECQGGKQVTKAEWDDFFATRPWYIDHFLLRANEIFQKYGVHGSTYGLVGETPSDNALRSDSIPWYMGFLFTGALGNGPDGTQQSNYQVLDDFKSLQK